MNNTDSMPQQPNDPVGPRNPGGGGPSTSDLTGPAADLKQQLAVLQTLSASPFHQHFLERFLDGLGRWLGLPWWAVHALLYGLTLALFVGLGHVHTQFPYGGYLALSGPVVEFVFTTYLLWHIRQNRTRAFLIVARIASGRERLTWLCRYWGPMHWGWVIPLASPHRSAPPSPWSWMKRLLAGLFGPVLRLPVWGATAILLGFFYATVLWTDWHPGPVGAPGLRFPHELNVYPDLAKAAMMLAVLANFWTLRGFMRSVSGYSPVALSPVQRLGVLHDCHRSTARLSCVVGLVTGLWLFAYGLDHGFTRWSVFLSILLAVMLLVNRFILRGLPRRSFSFPEALGQVPAWVHLALRQTPIFVPPTTRMAVLASIMCPVALNLLGALMGGASSG